MGKRDSVSYIKSFREFSIKDAPTVGRKNTALGVIYQHEKTQPMGGAADKTYMMEGPGHLRKLFDALLAEGFRVAGPKVKDAAIVVDFLDQFEDLPLGYKDSQEPGKYRLQQANSLFYFGYSVGPQSLKSILHPSRRRLLSADRQGGSWTFQAESSLGKPLALFGIRSCDLQALRELDKVFLSSGTVDEAYAKKKDQLLIVSATCLKPSELCFCTSMGDGPRAKVGYDINLTEIFEGDSHCFLADAGTFRGERILQSLHFKKAKVESLLSEAAVVQRSRQKIKKTLPTDGLPRFLKENLEHPRWDEVAQRCLSCGNCTMVCPTCFCTTVDDVTDLQGQHSERWLKWDSCFTAEFSFIHGGVVRASTRSRYRNWLVHKLSTWHDQFKSSGCVGCGRCIAWCPVGIDLIEEVEAMRTHNGSST